MKPKFYRLICAGVFLVGGLFCFAAAAQAPMNIQERPDKLYQDPVSTFLTTEEFIYQAGLKNLYKIKTGELALDKGYNTSVLQYARQVVDHHSRMSHDLSQSAQRATRSAAQNRGLIPLYLDSRYQLQLEALQNAPIDDFDAYYISDQRRVHAQMLQIYTNYIENKEGEASVILQAYAKRNLPVIEQQGNILRQMDNLVLSGR